MRDHHKLPTFVSPFPDGSAWAMDAMLISWMGMWAYTFPPFPLVPKVLAKKVRNKLRSSSSTVVAKAHLGTRLTRVERGAAPGASVLGGKLFMQPKSVVYHQNLQVLQLHAWRLLLKALDLPDYRRTWLKELHVASFDSLP